jgi:hypothetical protein
MACLGLGASPAPGGEIDSEWSARLMLEQAEIERARERLDQAKAAYARAVAGSAPEDRTRELARERDDLAVALRKAERALPRLIEEARRAGVSPEVLKPYRFAVSPAHQP